MQRWKLSLMHQRQDMRTYKMAKLIVVLLLLVCYTSVQARVTCIKTLNGRVCKKQNTGEVTVKRHYKESGITTFTTTNKGRKQRGSGQRVMPIWME